MVLKNLKAVMYQKGLNNKEIIIQINNKNNLKKHTQRPVNKTMMIEALSIISLIKI